jgi:hypothetical protein
MNKASQGKFPSLFGVGAGTEEKQETVVHSSCVEIDSRDSTAGVDGRACRPRGAWRIDRGEDPIGSPQKSVKSCGRAGGIVSSERPFGINRVGLGKCATRDIESGEGSVQGSHEAMLQVACVNVTSSGRSRRIDADRDGGVGIRDVGKTSRNESPVRGAQETMVAYGRGTEISCNNPRRIDH